MEKQIQEATFKDVLKTIQGKTKNPVWTKDFTGNKVFVGDRVVFSESFKSALRIGVVSRVTPKGARDERGFFYLSNSIFKINE